MPPSTPFYCPRYFNVLVVPLSTPFLYFSGIICGPLRGSPTVLGSFAVQSGNHLRSGIICGPGIICGAVQPPISHKCFYTDNRVNCTSAPFLISASTKSVPMTSIGCSRRKEISASNKRCYVKASVNEYVVVMCAFFCKQQ